MSTRLCLNAWACLQLEKQSLKWQKKTKKKQTPDVGVQCYDKSCFYLIGQRWRQNTTCLQGSHSFYCLSSQACFPCTVYFITFHDNICHVWACVWWTLKPSSCNLYLVCSIHIPQEHTLFWVCCWLWMHEDHAVDCNYISKLQSSVACEMMLRTRIPSFPWMPPTLWFLVLMLRFLATDLRRWMYPRHGFRDGWGKEGDRGWEWGWT